MKKQIETKDDGKEFERFEDFVRQVVSVPKSEINRREKQEKERREVQKNDKLDTRRRA